MKTAYDGCSNYRHYREQELEEQVWQEVRALLRDPDKLRAGIDTVIEMRRSALRGDPEREAKVWLDKLAEVDQERRGYLRLAARGRITDAELDEAFAELEETRQTSEQELAAALGRREEIEELERARDTLLESYEALALEELDDLTPEEHHGFYRTLRMIVYVHPEGGVELTGEFLPFGPAGPDDPTSGGSGGTPGSNGTGPGGNGGGSSATRGFSTNINTRAYAGAATALPAFADHPHQATPAVRKLSRLHGVCPGRRQGARQVF
jgi:hypothetical protein